MLLSASDRHHELELIAADTPGFDHVGLEVESERELEELNNRLTATGSRILETTSYEGGLETRLSSSVRETSFIRLTLG